MGGRRERLGGHRIVVRVLEELGGGRGLVGRAIAGPPPSGPGGPAHKEGAPHRDRGSSRPRGGGGGPPRPHETRLERLTEAGVDDAGVARLRSPIGLDIGARTPEETAISIMSEIIALRTRRSTRALSAIDGPIHD